MNQKRILFLTHETRRSGAPLVLFYFLQWLKQNHDNYKVTVLALRGGGLTNDFKEVADEVMVLPSRQKDFYFKGFPKNLLLKWTAKRRETALRNLRNYDFDLLYANSIATVALGAQLKKDMAIPKMIVHIHELEGVIKKILPNFEDHIKDVDFFIAASEKTKFNLEKNFNVPPDEVKVIYSFVPLKEKEQNSYETFTVGGIGTVEKRKGVDYFIKLAWKIHNAYPEYNIDFKWIGSLSENNKSLVVEEIKETGLRLEDIFLGEVQQPEEIINKFSVLAMTSREDPFPLVCIEAGMLGKPIICFKGATGTEEVLVNGGGEIISNFDVDAMAEEVINYYLNKMKLENDGKRAQELFSNFTAASQAPTILKVINDFLID